MRRALLLLALSIGLVGGLAPSRPVKAAAVRSAGSVEAASRRPRLRSAEPRLRPRPAPPPARSPLPIVFAPAPVTAPDAGQCRQACARDYYLCLAGEADDMCPSDWIRCRADCARDPAAR